MNDAKLIYLARRNPAIERAAFPARWLQHSAFARPRANRAEMGYATVAYCAVDQASGADAGGGDGYDGVGLMDLEGLHSIDASHRYLQSVVRTDLGVDEIQTFGKSVVDFTLYCASEPLLNGPQTEWAIILLVRRPEDLTPTEFTLALADLYRRLWHVPAVSEGLQRYVRNIVVRHPGPDYQYDAIEELWFPSEAEMLTARDGMRQLLEDGPLGGAHSHLLTTKIIMQKRLPPLPHRL